MFVTAIHACFVKATVQPEVSEQGGGSCREEELKGQSDRYLILLQQQERALRSFPFASPASLQMDENMKNCLNWIQMVSMSPIAILVLILLALVSLLQFLFKTSLLFIIVAINTPFALMYNVSILVFDYYGSHFLKFIERFPKANACFGKCRVGFYKSSGPHLNWSDPRASVGIEVQTIVSDFFKVIAGELLVIVSGGIITYYTAPLLVFYISMAISLAALSHQWLNTKCLSKTALSCLFGGYGLNPMMFLFSYIGFFNIGCHPVAKCSFAAKRAFLFVKDDIREQSQKSHSSENEVHIPIIAQPQISHSSENQVCPSNSIPKIAHRKEIVEDNDGHNPLETQIEMVKAGVHHPFNGEMPNSNIGCLSISFQKWNAFERGLFQLSPEIEIDNTELGGKYVLKSFMVLKLLNHFICKYSVERLELPEDFSKGIELYNFFVTLSEEDGFVTDKMRGRYEHSLTLLEIVEGVKENTGYEIVDTILKKEVFVVAD